MGDECVRKDPVAVGRAMRPWPLGTARRYDAKFTRITGYISPRALGPLTSHCLGGVMGVFAVCLVALRKPTS